jgi:hypothetical protein
MSAQQCMRRLKNKVFFLAYCNCDKIIAEEEERGADCNLGALK